MSRKRKKRKELSEKWQQELADYWGDYYEHENQNKGQTVNVQTNSTSRPVIKELVQNKGIPGFMDAVFKHQIVETKLVPKFEFKMDREMWQQICAFFEWTQGEWKSESQVRLFVNTSTKKWAAWAFPQEMNTGMSARELDKHPNWDKDLLRFKANEGWWYFGTVHHHCSSNAFQSGTDEENERKIDGLHMTVGNIGSDQYSLHARLSLGGLFFPVNMLWFWDPGDYMKEIPLRYRSRLPSAAEECVLQMAEPPPKDFQFPKEWRDNIIAKPKETTRVIAGFGNMDNEDKWYGKDPYCDRGKGNKDWELRRARSGVLRYLNKKYDYTSPKSGVKSAKAHALQILNGFLSTLDDEDLDILDILSQCDILPGNFITFLEAMPETPKTDDKKSSKDEAPKMVGNGETVIRVGQTDHCAVCKGILPSHEPWCDVMKRAYAID